MTFPGHLERLVQSCIERDVSRCTQHVSITHFARSSRSEAAIRSERIAEQVRLPRLRRRRLDRSHANAIRLHVPVRGPYTAVKRRRRDRKTTVPTEDSGGGPTPEDFVDDAVRVRPESLAA